MIKKLSLLLLILSLFASNLFAENDFEDLPSQNLDTWSSLKLKWSNAQLNPFTIEGQNAGCSVYPDEVINSLRIYSTIYRDPIDWDSNTHIKQQDLGKVNIYAIQENGKWKFLREINYHSSYTFIKGTTYALEFYDCPNEELDDLTKTPNGNEHGDVICKDDNLVQINFYNPNDVTKSYTYDRITSCSGGCENSVCIDSDKDNLPKYEESTRTGDLVDYWDENQANEELKQLREELNEKSINLTLLNQKLDENSPQKKIIEGQLSAIENQEEQLKDQSNLNFTPFLIILAIVGVIGLVVLK